jgi:hypothetical protein
LVRVREQKVFFPTILKDLPWNKGMQRSGNSNKYFENESWSHPLTMIKEKLVEKIKKILNGGVELAFLLKLNLEELRVLPASLRNLIDRAMEGI